MVVKANQPARVLARLLSRGAVDSQFEHYLERMRKPGGLYSFREKNDGKEVAEALLLQRCRGDRCSDFAAAIQPVVRGMLAMARVDAAHEYCKLFDPIGERAFPSPFAVSPKAASNLVVVFNRQPPAGSCAQPEGSDVWGVGGRLGLQALTLHAGKNGRGKTVVRLGLVLPQRAHRSRCSNGPGYAAVCISPEGDADLWTYARHREGMPAHTLRLAERDVSIERIVLGNAALGELFPFATDYLADNLPKLEVYLTELAAMVAGELQH